MSFWEIDAKRPTSLDDWKRSIRLACRWMIDTAMVRTVESPFGSVEYPHVRRYRDWRGAFRGEYSAATRRWDVFAPVWHGGQGVKALALAHQALGDAELLDAARFAADFILRHQIIDPADDDRGLILAFEDARINTTAILESLDGLFTLHELTGDVRYAHAAVAALRWVLRKAYISSDGRFREEYDLDARRYAEPYPSPSSGRLKAGAPSLDDGVLVKAWRLTGERAFLDAALRVAERLLADENPPGNWLEYSGHGPTLGLLHPRNGYWWGRPLWMVAQAAGRDEFLACCRRAAQWYADAMRLDGGLFRDTGAAFRTPSFGHATSGTACAAILFIDLAREFGDTQWDEPAARALRFCYSVQFDQAADANLQGAVLEKVMAPNGSDAPPWYLRDVGTFFYVQAACRAIMDRPHVLGQ